ncbi:MAG: DUF1573 domain-containing protein [Bacteroidia bacterium]
MKTSTWIGLLCMIICGKVFAQQPTKSIEKLPKLQWLKEEIRKDSSSMGVFETAVYDFGEVRLGDSVWHNFQFKNVGKAPLQISDVIASCECTVTNFIQNPVAPKKKGYVTGGFKVKQEGKLIHTLTIFDNTTAGTRYVELRFRGVKK